MLTTHFTPAPRPIRRPFLSQLAGLTARTWTTWQQRRAQRKTVRILNGLDSRTLKDIGVTPGEIESVVYGDPHDRTRLYRSNWQL